MEPHTQISSLYTWITTLFSNTRIIYLLRDPNHCAKKKKKKKKKKRKKLNTHLIYIILNQHATVHSLMLWKIKNRTEREKHFFFKNRSMINRLVSNSLCLKV